MVMTVNGKKKSKWYGIFNFHLSIKQEYAYAYSKKQAKIIMARRIAQKQDVSVVVVLKYLKDNPDSYEIKEEL